ncbi:MAG: hypothetical protein Q7J68_05245 [Thermoplasmata archaeon]|nr:hypothetical protein [Thermoplasmata archaeon]
MENITGKEVMICVKDIDSLEIVREGLIDAGFNPKVMKITDGRGKHILKISRKSKAKSETLFNKMKERNLIDWYGEREIKGD